MQIARIPENEIQRLKKLQMYQILDTSAEEVFDRITRIVAESLGVPMALVSLVDRDRQWFKSRVGLDATETPRELAFCAHAILGDEILEIQDALKDERFSDNPLVAGAPDIRFYAGAPLKTPDGYNLGTLCAIDQTPHQLTEAQRRLLSDLASIVVDEMELRIALRNAVKEMDFEARANAMKDEFISNITHELRTPLTSIRGSLGLINAGALGDIPGSFKEPLQIADRNATNLLHLINDLLDVQKLSTGHMEYEIESVDVSALIEEACENIQGMAIDKNIEIKFKSVPDVTIAADGQRLQQVFANVLSNAIKFSPDGESVTVGLERFGSFVCISITDQGPGVPEEFIPTLFDKFSQARRKSDTSGTGLGLSISKSIVDAHQGTIRLDTSKNTGTTFHVELPIRQTIVPK